jgi:hypothetical protein
MNKKHNFNWLICKKLKASLGALSYDEIVRALIVESNWVEILECVAAVAKEDGFKIKAFKDGKQVYPWVEEE